MDYAAALARITTAAARINRDMYEDDLERAVQAIDEELAVVVGPIADFVIALDDGTGASNSTESFGLMLAERLDPAHRVSLMYGVILRSSPDELKAMAQNAEITRRDLLNDDEEVQA